MKKYLLLLLLLVTVAPQNAHAARLFTSGFELNSVVDAVEFTTNQPPSGSFSISTTNVRSGTYAGRINGASAFWRQHVFTANQTTTGYISVAIYIVALPNQNTQLIRWSNVANTSVGNITLKTTGALSLLKSDGTQIGSDSATLNLNQWYYVELKNDASGAGALEGKIDGTSFASGANSNQGQWGRALIGEITGTQTTNDIYFDDWKINDSSGSSQTGYPGLGKVLIARPNGNGETTQWTIAGSAAAATNWQGVNEVTPNDGTTLNNEALLNKEDLYTVGSLGLQSYDTINLVQVGIRFNNDVADATTAFKWEIEKASGGTKLQSASVVPNSTTWRTNSTAAPDVYALTAYTDPDGAAWTNTTLDSMRIGMIAGLVGVNKIQVSNIWAYVDYTPGTPPASSFNFSNWFPY